MEKYTYILDTERRVVSEIITGEWLEFDACSYSLEYTLDIAPQFNSKPWSKKVDLNFWIPNERIVELIGKHLEWAHNEGGMKFSANICLGETKRKYLKQMFKAGGVGNYCQIFRGAESAERWLKEKGF